MYLNAICVVSLFLSFKRLCKVFLKTTKNQSLSSPHSETNEVFQKWYQILNVSFF